MVRDLIPWRKKRDNVQLTRVEPAESNPIQALHREINDVFEDFFESFDRGLRFPALGALRARADAAAFKVDVSETDKEVRVVADLPGMDEKDIDVDLNDNLLTIRGEKKHEREEKEPNYHLMERSYGMFQRVIPLPGGLDESKAKATFKKGVLTVTLPKTADSPSRRKKITVSQD